ADRPGPRIGSGMRFEREPYAERRTAVRASMLGVATLALLVFADGPARAFYLDDDRDVSVRMRAYVQGSMATQAYEGKSDPGIGVGQIVQQRNFFNPEIDIKATPYLDKWFGASFFDEVSLRGAAWGFYDGYIDYGASGFADRVHQEHFNYQP